MGELVPLSRVAVVLAGTRYFVVQTADVSLRSTRYAAALAALGVDVAAPDEWIYRERRDGAEVWPQVGFDATFPREDTVAGWVARLESAASASEGARRIRTDIGDYRGSGVLRSTAEDAAELGGSLRSAWWSALFTGNMLAVGLVAVAAWLWLRRR